MQYHTISSSPSVTSVSALPANGRASKVHYLTPITSFVVVVLVVAGAALAAPAAESVQFKTLAADASKRLADLRARLPSLKSDLDGVKARGQDISYPQVSFTVLENSVRYAE